MTTTTTTASTLARDLRKEPPRSGNSMLGRYAWLARMADKARAQKAGTANGYEPYCEISKGFLERCGIPVETFDTLIFKGYSDHELVEYFDRCVSNAGREAAMRWILVDNAREIHRSDIEEGRVKPGDVRDAAGPWTRTASAQWFGPIAGGYGEFTAGSDLYGGYSYDSRFGDAPGSTPEQLLAAAHAACFSMALSLVLGKAGHMPSRIKTSASATIERSGEGFSITNVALHTLADIFRWRSRFSPEPASSWAVFCSQPDGSAR